MNILILIFNTVNIRYSSHKEILFGFLKNCLKQRDRETKSLTTASHENGLRKNSMDSYLETYVNILYIILYSSIY